MVAVMRNEIIPQWAHILELIQKGESVIVQNEKSAEKIAVIMPYTIFERKSPRPLGLLKGKASYKIKRNFKMTDEEFLGL